jgi:poly-gamma-glutamate synthesis protein (capsule biosynthesis protein)
LTLAYLAKLDPAEGRLVEARLVPVQVRRFRLQRASKADVAWLGNLFNRLGAPLGTRVQVSSHDSLILRW